MTSHVQLFATPWTVAHQAPLSLGISQARILERVATSSSRGFPLLQGWNPGLPHCRQILYLLSPQGSPVGTNPHQKKVNHGQVGGNIIRCFTNFWFPKFFFKKNLKDLQEKKKKREGCKRIFVWLE